MYIIEHYDYYYKKDNFINARIAITQVKFVNEIRKRRNKQSAISIINASTSV